AFRYIDAIMSQVGSWFAQQISNFKAAVASAVRAAGRVWDAVVASVLGAFTAPVRGILAFFQSWGQQIAVSSIELAQAGIAVAGSPAAVVRMAASISDLLSAVFRPEI